MTYLYALVYVQLTVQILRLQKIIFKINKKRFVYVRSLIVYLYSKTKRNEKTNEIHVAKY